jgi:D-glycero-beta-D-manno-heptose 1-phosphate adenylyltransferase
LIAAVEPDVLVKGADWAIDKIVGAEQVLKKGGAVRRISFAKGYSTSAIIEKVVKNYCPARSKKS